ERGGEPIGDLRVNAPTDGLHGVEISGALVANVIDELPVLAIAAACAHGPTRLRDAAELRHKESDRLSATAAVLRAMGATVEEHDDGLTIAGGTSSEGAPFNGGVTVDAYGDHRIAMAVAIAALAADAPTRLTGAEHVEVSFPGFWNAL